MRRSSCARRVNHPVGWVELGDMPLGWTPAGRPEGVYQTQQCFTLDGYGVVMLGFVLLNPTYALLRFRSSFCPAVGFSELFVGGHACMTNTAVADGTPFVMQASSPTKTNALFYPSDSSASITFNNRSGPSSTGLGSPGNCQWPAWRSSGLLSISGRLVRSARASRNRSVR